MKPLRTSEIAQGKGINISQLQIKAQIGMSTTRRYWYCTQDGSKHGETLVTVHLPTLQAIARALGVSIKDLFVDSF